MLFLTSNLLGISIALIILWIYRKLKQRFNYFKDRSIPQAEQSWMDILKSLSLSSFSENPLKYYERLSKSMPYVGMFQGFFMPNIIVMDTEMIQDILIKDFSHFHDHGFDQDVEINPLSGHLFNMRGDRWRTLRHKLVPAFTSGKLKGMVQGMEQCADNLIQEMKQEASLREDVNMKSVYSRYTLAVIAKCAFGIDPDSIKDPNCPFRQMLQRVLTPTILDQVKITSVMMFPKLTSMLKIEFWPPGMTEFFRNLTKDTFRMRKESGTKRNDFIQLLMELKEKGQVQVDSKELEDDEMQTIKAIQQSQHTSHLEMTDDLLMAQIFVFIVGGFDNSSFLCAIVSYALSKHLEIQQRAREEVEEIKRRHGGIDYIALRDMTFLGACVDESLRLYAPIPILVRECTQSYTFKNGLRVDKGASIVIPSRGLHYDSKYWTNPSQYNPQRFLSDNINKSSYLPFGDGPRICIAQRLALIMVKLLMAKILENFEILPSKKTKEPVQTRLLISSDFVGGAWANFKPLIK